MPWLRARLGELGVEFEHRRVLSLDEELGSGRWDVVVNCSGLGAAQLAQDADVIPVRGQVIKIYAPAVREWVVDMDGPNSCGYVLPRASGVCVMGGTHQENDWRRADSEVRRARAVTATATVEADASAHPSEERPGCDPCQLPRAGAGAQERTRAGHLGGPPARAHVGRARRRRAPRGQGGCAQLRARRLRLDPLLGHRPRRRHVGRARARWEGWGAPDVGSRRGRRVRAAGAPLSSHATSARPRTRFPNLAVLPRLIP